MNRSHAHLGLALAASVTWVPAMAEQADPVVLSADPLAVDPMSIREIRVLETIKEGQSVYKATA